MEPPSSSGTQERGKGTPSNRDRGIGGKKVIRPSCADIFRFHFHVTLIRDVPRKKNKIVICK
jgi:hypothetical protein